MTSEKPWFRDELAKARAFNESLPPHARLVVSRPVTSKENAMSEITGAQRIANERQRQITEEGYTLAHDVEHDNGALAWAAAVYAAPERFYRVTVSRGEVAWWEPWPKNWRREGVWSGDRKLHGTDERIRELVKAGALIAAEIDRLAALAEVTP